MFYRASYIPRKIIRKRIKKSYKVFYNFIEEKIRSGLRTSEIALYYHIKKNRGKTILCEILVVFYKFIYVSNTYRDEKKNLLFFSNCGVNCEILRLRSIICIRAILFILRRLN